MKKIISILLILVFLAASHVSQVMSAENVSADDKAIGDKATELVTGKNLRLEKISVIHSFVRDEIGQAKTQFG